MRQAIERKRMKERKRERKKKERKREVADGCNGKI